MSDVAKTPKKELECKKKYLYEYSMFFECNDGSKCQILEDDVVRLLNEQQATITALKEENEKLRKELSDCEKFRYAVFKGMEKIIEEKKNDNGGFQVWEVPPIPKGKRISFTTNNDCD